VDLGRPLPVRALFTSLVDDAGLFPPKELAMADALARYRRDRSTGHPVLSGRFLCPSAALSTLRANLADDDHVRVGLIVPLSSAAVRDAVTTIDGEPRLELASVEGVPPTTIADAITALRGLAVPRYIELPTRVPAGDLDSLAEAGVGAKVRCGGQKAELFPSADDLAGFIVACVERGVPMKATAGLHHAVRYRDPVTGFTHHGFLNLILAVCRAESGGDARGVVDVLVSEDAGMLAAVAAEVPANLAAAARAALVCYGSCSTSEPIEDLEILGLLGTGVR
jgi:hypothetical protein